MVVLQRAELGRTMAELRDTKNLKTENSVMESRLMSSEGQLEAMKTDNAAIVSRLTSSESEVERLQKENAERPKVAFSTSFGETGQHGPFHTATTVVFQNIFSNTGNH
ncbi:uncharacterized protein ACWYII_002417 [Salvelinus alpinus]